MTDRARAYRLVGTGGDGKRTVVISGVTFENAVQTMDEFTDYPLFDRLTIEDEETGEPASEWGRPRPPT